MKAIIVHGWGGYPGEGWQSWLKAELEGKTWKVESPEMPDTETPKIEKWVSKLQEFISEIDKETYLIGHSIGCQGILRFLETLDDKVKIGGCIFVAPWMYLDENTIKEEGEEVVEITKPWTETPINWKSVRKHTKKFICILSDNDPYVPLTNEKLFKEKLNAEIIIEHGKKHFSGGDGVNELPIVLKKLEEISK